MTYYVGVDVAKFEHVASILDSKTGELVLDSFHFENSIKGFKELLSNLSKLKKIDVMVGFESTAHYHQNLFNYLTEKQYKCYLINPLMVSRFRSISLRDAKNDNIDSRAISNFLLLEHKNLINEEFSINELKELCLQRDYLMRNQTQIKIKLVSYLDRVFPELCKTIPDGTLYSKGIFAILKEYPTAKAISEVRIDHLINLAKTASKGRYKESLVIKIKEAAKSSIGFDSRAVDYKVRGTLTETNKINKKTIGKIDDKQYITNNFDIYREVYDKYLDLPIRKNQRLIVRDNIVDVMFADNHRKATLVRDSMIVVDNMNTRPLMKMRVYNSKTIYSVDVTYMDGMMKPKNAITVKPGNILYAYDHDFVKHRYNHTVMILGSNELSKAARYALLKNSNNVTIVNRFK